MSTLLASLPPDPAAAGALLETLLEMSLTGVALLRPVYAAREADIEDFTYAYLNPAAQRLVHLPERPGGSLLTLYPSARTEGVFAFYAAAFASGQPAHTKTHYQSEGLNGFYHLAARRHGELLLVNFTDSNDQPRSAVEEALRQSQAREQQALAQVEAQRQRLQALVDQAPVAIGYFEGPNLRITAANPVLSAMWGRQQAQVLGRPLLEGVPELQGQGFEDLMQQVRETGVPFAGTEAPAQMLRDGQVTTTYYNFVYQPLYDEQGTILGVIDVAVEVTEQVRARQQVQALNAELATLNEELTASNAEYQLANAALAETQQQLRQFNDELEARVAQRTQELTGSLQATAALQAELLATAQRQVREREELYQVFEQAPVIVAQLRGPAHFFHYRNPAFQALFPGRALTGQLYADVMPEIVAAGLMPELDRVYATGQPYSGTAVPFVTTPPDGSAPHQRYYDFSYHPFREQDHTTGVSIFAYDVTEQVLAKQAREEQAQQLYRVLAQTPVAFTIFTGPELRITLANAAMAHIWGRPLAQVEGQPVFEVMPDLRDQGFEAIGADVLRNGASYELQERPIALARTHTGLPELGYFNITYQPQRDAAGRITGLISLAIEVTDQVVARQQVQQLNEELQATNQELHKSNAQLTRTNADLDNFVYTASHDLKSPITNIEGLLALLPEVLPEAVLADEEVAPVLGRMQESIERFRRTIGHLTEVSRLQAEFAQPVAAVPLAAVIEDVRADLYFQLAEVGAELEVAVDGAQPRVFSPKNLQSIIYNLLSNALKYRHPARPARVRISCQPQGDELRLAVQDNGLGLSEQQQGRLFGLFQRLHTHVEGSGVGLYAVKKIVENAGGRILVESQPGVGTTFTLLFPA